MAKNKVISDQRKRMDGSIGTLDHELKGLRAGRASPNLLDPVVVEAYGDRLPLQQLANISVPEPRTLMVQVWDKAMVKAVEKAIAAAELGLNPMAEGQTIRVNIPPLSEERRKEMVKIAHKYGEQAKIAIRNVRRDGMETLKKLEKDGEISKDEHHGISDDVQKITDEYVKKIDDMVAAKEKDILQG